jgi:hypothetical protein
MRRHKEEIMEALETSTEFNAPTKLRLARGNLAGINNGRGVLVRVERGQVWLTRANEITDTCLETGESFPIDRDGLTLVSALGREPFAVVSLEPPAAPGAARRAADLFRKLRTFPG